MGVAKPVRHEHLSGRLKALIAAFVILAAVFFLRLVYLQVIVADSYSAMAEETRTVSFTTTPHRGTIYDRNGIVLAISVEATTVYANPSEVTDPAGASRQLATILGGKAADYEALLSKDTTFVYLKRQADVEVADKIEDLDIAGVYCVDDTRREYPNGSVAGQVVGYCNVDGEGITGLELQYNDILKGRPGDYRMERGGDGTPIPGAVHQSDSAIDGCDIMVSLDLKLQRQVEEILADGVTHLGTNQGSSVIMDAETGEIYAICSLPYMDPSNMQASQSGSDQVKPITQAFEPGSVFKTASILSVLENRVMGPDDTLFCPATITADEYRVSDAHDRGDETLSLRQILDRSSNVGVSLAVEKEGFTPFYEALLRYGLTDLTGVDYPGEAQGVLSPRDDWAKITGYNISFGQGVTVTPLSIARFYGAIINDGVALQPHFLVRNLSTDKTPDVTAKKISGDDEALTTLRDMLRTVVVDGTGADAAIEGFDVIGKTSTAQIADAGIYKDGVFNLGFVGALDNSTSKLVCYVGAGEVTGLNQVTQIFHDIMADAVELYNITPAQGD